MRLYKTIKHPQGQEINIDCITMNTGEYFSWTGIMKHHVLVLTEGQTIKKLIDPGYTGL